LARKARDEKKVEVIGLLGVGLDNSDGHKRVTRGDDFVLVGGSQETHERMQDVVIQVTESLQDRGKRLRDAEARELLDLLHKALDR
jgi:hypothetical protein